MGEGSIYMLEFDFMRYVGSSNDGLSRKKTHLYNWIAYKAGNARFVGAYVIFDYMESSGIDPNEVDISILDTYNKKNRKILEDKYIKVGWHDGYYYCNIHKANFRNAPYVNCPCGKCVSATYYMQHLGTKYHSLNIK
jgi:hypothetical protein